MGMKETEENSRLGILKMRSSAQGVRGGEIEGLGSIWSLATLATVTCIFLLHALFLPAYEGPDEPFHLARILAFAEEAWTEGWAGRQVQARVVASVRASRCGPDLARAFGCTPFVGTELEVEAAEPEAPGAYPNYEAHQPPLYYWVAAGVTRAGLAMLPEEDGGFVQPAVALMFLRMSSAALAATGVWLLVFVAGREWTWEAKVLVGSLFLFPGAAESLVRVANDVGVFLWCSILVALASRRRLSGWRLGLACSLGPLIKLTAFPVVVFAVVRSWLRGERRGAVAAAALSLVVIPLQWARGYGWGGTVELNVAANHSPTGPLSVALGLGKSALVGVKTALWLGGWSFFRPPRGLLLATAAVALWVLMRNGVRISAARSPLPHAGALFLAGAGFALFSWKHFQYFGVWGGVGGWYFWGWVPWLVVLARDCLSFGALDGTRRAARWTLLSAIVWNLVWFAIAWKLYYRNGG